MQTLQLEKKLHDWTKTGTYEYLLVAQLAADVSQSIEEEKRLFFAEEKFDAPGANYISIASFTARDEMEPTLIRYMERIFSSRSSFQVSLNNYSGIPPHTIFLRVQDVTPFRLMAAPLKGVSDYVQSCSCPPIKICHPHVVVANNLSQANYLHSMMRFSQKTFYASFSVNEVMLLRRSGPLEPAKRLQVFPLVPAGYHAFKNKLFN